MNDDQVKALQLLGLAFGGVLLLAKLAEDQEEPFDNDDEDNNLIQTRRSSRDSSDSSYSSTNERPKLSDFKVSNKDVSSESRSKSSSDNLKSLTSMKRGISKIPENNSSMRVYPSYYYNLSKGAQYKFRKKLRSNTDNEK